MHLIKINTVVVTESESKLSLKKLEERINKKLNEGGITVQLINLNQCTIKLNITTVTRVSDDFNNQYHLTNFIMCSLSAAMKIHTVLSAKFEKVIQPTTGTIQKFKDLLLPELEKIIIVNRLVFTHSRKFHVGEKSLYLNFAAYNNTLDQWQKVCFEPATGYLSITLHHQFIRPKK